MDKLFLIIRREYLSRIRRRSFLIMTIVTPFIFWGVLVLPALFIVDDTSSKQDILVIGDSASYYTRALNVGSSCHFIDATDEYLQNADDDTEIYASIVLPADLVAQPHGAKVLSGSVLPKSLQEHIESHLSFAATQLRMERAVNRTGLSSLSYVEAKPEYTLSGSTAENEEATTVMALFIAFVIYIFIFSYGTQIMKGVSEEKTNKVMEVMFLSAKPSHFILGKIIGVALVGVTQFACWGVLLSVALGAIGNEEYVQSIVSALPDGVGFFSILFFFVLFFFLGYLLYASFFAVIGSISDPNTDTQQFLLPVTLPILFSIYVGLYSSFHPESAIAFWCSYIPFTSPVVMMVRLCFGINPGEALFAVLILTVTVSVCICLAAKIYERTILSRGGVKSIWGKM